MSTTETRATRAETRHAERRAYDGWLLRAFPEPSQSSIFLRAVLLSGAILVAEYVVEVVWLDLYYWRLWDSYLAAPGVILSALGLVFTLVLLGQWGTRYVELWADVRSAFDVPDERYNATIRPSLRALYGRDHVPFLLFVVVQVSVYSLLPRALPAGYLHVGFLHFFAATALYCVYRHVLTVRRMTDLDLADVAHARPTLSKVADVGFVVGINWFLALALLLVYVRDFLLTSESRYDFLVLSAVPVVNLWEFYALVGMFLVAVGLVIFLVPVLLLHGALAAAKRERIRHIGAEYETLFEDWNEGDLEGDPSAGLEIIEKRRRNAEALSTWPYRLASLGQLILGSLVPTAASVVPVVLEVVQNFSSSLLGRRLLTARAAAESRRGQGRRASGARYVPCKPIRVGIGCSGPAPAGSLA